MSPWEMCAVHHGSTRPALNGKWCQTSCSARQLTSGWAGCWYKTQRCCGSSWPPLAAAAFILRCAAIRLPWPGVTGGLQCRIPARDPVGRELPWGRSPGLSPWEGDQFLEWPEEPLLVLGVAQPSGEEKEGDEVAGPVSSPLVQLQRLGVRGSLSSGEVKQLKPLA